jgi:hypothetical protein
MHPVKLSRAILGMSQGIKQNDFTIAIRQSAENCHMLVYRFETTYLFSHPFGAVDEVIIQTTRHRNIAVNALVDEFPLASAPIIPI